MVQMSKERGIMVSDFVSEDDFLQLNNVSDVTNKVQYSAREQLEYGENAKGYWANERFLK